MDDSLELPNSVSKKPADLLPEDDDQSSGDEDGALDWTKIIPAAARPVIPKRGEKEFEPRAHGGTGLQTHILYRARSAMFETLRATRTISSKGISYGIWHPTLGRTQITVPRGIHFLTMGHSVPRPTIDESGVSKMHKRLELLPEEAIYLIERGALFCWKECDVDTTHLQGFEGIAGAPMSVQQAYVEMIGRDNLTLERFQVYAYLRRLGYAVTRCESPNDSYPMAPPFDFSKRKPNLSLFRHIFSSFSSLFSKALSIFTLSFSWWRPFRISRWVHHDYALIYRFLRFLPSGHSVPLQQSSKTATSPASPYKVFFNVYKPSSPFKKTAPPLPDFQIVVVNARTTPIPTLHELSALFDLLPELPPPLPRPRRQAYGGKLTEAKTSDSPSAAATVKQPQSPQQPQAQTQHIPTLLQRLFPSLLPPELQPQRKTNPFVALKQGKKTIIIAAVDNGNISFFRFSQGAFEEWPMI
ncbi:putative tRNA-splicing endonuclease subunit sen54 [Leucoagaricus sp. SymC.cos]|nr:putative tRNA-splicing endonuclease subunit sen54 [Leucoagaricus sp. SymC.cos]